MQTKDASVECRFHPVITQLLFHLDEWYIAVDSELIITSGSEHTTHHSRNSFHYADPCCAVDIRSWDITCGIEVYDDTRQYKTLARLAIEFCKKHSIPISWIEVILETDHIHIEYQPKRRY